MVRLKGARLERKAGPRQRNKRLFLPRATGLPGYGGGDGGDFQQNGR